MRRTVGLLLVLAITVAATAPAAASEQTPLVTLAGAPVPEEAVSGDLIAIFFASWSPRCRGVVEQANALQKQWGSRARVMLVSFQEEAASVERFLAGRSVEVETVRDPDGAFSKKHGITTLPSLLVLENGAVAFRGRLPSEPDSVLAPIFD